MGRMVLRVSAELLMELFKDGPTRTYGVIAHGLPEDATLIDCRMERFHNPPFASLVIESAAYPPVADGAAYPEAEPVVCSLITAATDA